MKRLIVCVVFVLSSLTGVSSPPEAPKEIIAKAGKVYEFTVKADGKKKFGKTLVGGKAAFRGFPGDSPNETVFWLVPETDGPLWIVWVTEGETNQSVTEVNKGVPHIDPKVDPNVDPVTPVPVVPSDTLKSFRVIFVHESMNNLSLGDRAVIYGRVTEEYLNSKCTGGKSGWRRREKDAPGEADPTMSALWESVKPKTLSNGLPDPNRITSVPCVVMERNNKVEIVNLEPTPSKMVEVFQKYRGN